MANKTRLFRGIDVKDLEDFLSSKGALKRRILKEDYIFREGEEPEGLYILLEGSVEVEKITPSGNRQVVNRFTDSGTVFGEVYIFLEDRPYDFGCVAKNESHILYIPKTAFDAGGGEVAERLISNMLRILSEKALFLNQKMLIHSAGSIRKKIAMHLLQKLPVGGTMELMKREDLAEYLAVPRPSLSRELMKLHREGFIELDGRVVRFDASKVEEILF